MEDEVFHGYYGRNTVMTSCLVLMEEDMEEDDIRECLDKVKEIDKGLSGQGRDRPWLSGVKTADGWESTVPACNKTVLNQMQGRCQKSFRRM